MAERRYDEKIPRCRWTPNAGNTVLSSVSALQAGNGATLDYSKSAGKSIACTLSYGADENMASGRLETGYVLSCTREITFF